MGAFEQREEGFERAHALGEELRFKALSRRNKALGLWVAEQLALNGPVAIAYARELVEAEVGQTDDEALTRKLGDALAGARPEISAHRIRRKIEEMTARATREIQAGR